MNPSPPAPPVLVLTEDETLLDDLLRLCAAANAPAEVVHGHEPAATAWSTARLVLVGDDWALTRGRPPSRRAGVVLVGNNLDDHTIWQRGVAIGAETVLHLPDAEKVLADRIADAVETVGDPAPTIGVIPGRGGAGASTLAAALALAAARTGHRTTLVDADPGGGGLDLLLGAERLTGPRWPDFATTRGRMSWAAVADALPRVHGVSLLSWTRAAGRHPTGEAMASVLGAARRGGGAVVVDLPRGADEATTAALSRLDLGLLVVPGDLRSVAAARITATTAGRLVRDLRLVVRPGAALPAAEVSRLLDLPLAGEVPDQRRLCPAVDAGEPPGRDAAAPLGAFCEALVRRTLPAPARPRSAGRHSHGTAAPDGPGAHEAAAPFLPAQRRRA
ncbi:septum site-determining protein Ssd [Streptomyces bohaiensis]|uniref:Septum formation initiator n=1 Tax=Streptomyces bohaiensis TaxID=1431344 RepID=A0ABX1CAL2_9ACTN|nr:septum site-determining protein Ssd [Streptomyces bohaiensis]NJQ16141.1 septum formation initiator [Streptomyces bohaiensis]